MKAHAIPIARPDAGHGLSDLAPLEVVVGDARVVSLGEATHGTREFFQLKHRIFELLATKKGFDVFAIEASMPEGFDVDEYALTGRGDAEKALAGLTFTTWNTEELLDLIRWMRAYNADAKHTRKLRFYGFDMQTPTRAARVVQQYLRDVAPSTPTATHAMLTRLGTPRGRRPLDPPGSTDAVLSAAVVEDFDTNRIAWQKRTGAERWAVARQHAVVLSQFTRQPPVGLERTSFRDASMAANVRWILDRDRASKVVLWAHNGHVSLTGMGPVESMGQSLKKTLDRQLVTVGFAFDHGSFQAMEMPSASGRPRDFTVGPEAPGSLGASLALAGHPIAAFDLHTIPASGPVYEWFSARRPMRELGSAFDERNPSMLDVPGRVAERFDALVFVESTTAARPVGGRIDQTTLDAGRNLDFEERGKGIPAGWDARGAATWGYTVEVVDGGARQGKRSLSMHRAPGRHYGERNGNVRQHIDARPFAGKRVTVSADVKASSIGDGGAAVLWAQATPPVGPSTTVVITSKEWTRVSVTLDVPAGAEALTYGLELVGDGRVDADAFALDAK
jgi:erythromycin esterase